MPLWILGLTAGLLGTGPVEVLRTAMQFEKDSVVLYISMKEQVPENLGRAKVDKLIREELKHVSMLQEKLDALV